MTSGDLKGPGGIPIHIVQVLPYLQAAGTERHALELSKGLMQRGHTISLLAPAGPLSEAFTSTGIEHIEFPPFSGLPAPTFAGIQKALEEAITKYGPIDVIHCHAGIELLYGVRKAIKRFSRKVTSPTTIVPTVFTVHSYFGKYPSIDYALASRLAYRWSDRVIAVSLADGEKLIKFNQALRQKLTVIHNGMPADRDTSKHERQHIRKQLRQKLNVGPDTPVGLVVGRLTRHKGIDVLLSGLKEYEGPFILILIAGKGILYDELVRQAQTIHPEKAQVLFLGQRDDIPDLLAASDIMILPSRMEGLSLALIEAHSAGVPCLVTDVGGNTEIVQHGETGYVVPTEDPAALARQLQSAIKNKAALSQAGMNAKQRFKNYFTVDHMVRKTLDVYNSSSANSNSMEPL